MGIALTGFLFVLGLVLIIKGGDFFVDAAVWIAEAFHIPKFIIGATVVSFATTLPELLVSLIGTLEGSLGLAIGNAVGSVNGNLGLILGLSLVCLPAVIQRRQFALKGVLMILAAGMLWFFSRSGALGRAGSIAMLGLFAAFLWLNLRQARQSVSGAEDTDPVRKDRPYVMKMIAKFLLGVLGIVIGAQLLVNHGSAIARLLGVPESVIGVTLVAVGTSLPELVTTLTAIRKKQSELSIGNIIGANIIDLTVILPVCALVSGGSLPILTQTLRLDLPVCIGLSLLAILPSAFTRRFSRAQGILLLACYALYVGVLVVAPDFLVAQ